MNNPTILANLDPPKLGCLPIRTTLIVFSILGVISSPSTLISNTNPSVVGCLFSLGLNSCVLYGVWKYNDLALGLSLKLLYFLLILNFILFCTIPVIVASLATSETFYKEIINGAQAKQNIGKLTESEEFMGDSIVLPSPPNFHAGFIFGFAVEIAIAISFAALYVEVVMIRRFRKHATAWREGKAYEQIP